MVNINGVVDIRHGDQTDGTVTAKMNISGGGQVKIEKGRTDSSTIAKSITGGTLVEVEGGGWVVKASGITVVKTDESTETASSVADALKVVNAKTIILAADADPYVLAVADNDGIVIPTGVTIQVPKDATLKITTTSATPDLLTDSKGAIEVQAGGKLELPSDINSNTSPWIGGIDARLNLGDNGSATFQFASENQTQKAGTLTVSGDVSIPAGKEAILHLGSVPIDAVIAKDASVTVNGTLRAISGNESTEAPSKLTVNGTLTVADSGKLEVGSRATVEVTGTLSLPVLSKTEMSGTSNTSADGIKGDIIINGGSTVSYAGNTILGNNGYLTMTTGKATLNVSGANETNGTVSLTLNEGTAAVNNGNLRAFLVDDTAAIIPMDVTIASDATVNIPSEMKLTIVNGGSLTIAGDMKVDRGTLRLNSGAELDGDVSVTNGGIVTLHSGDAGAKTTLNDSKINLASGGIVYSQFEADNSITGTAVEKEAEGSYTVDGMDGITFAYRYASTEPVTPPDPEPETYTITFNANGGSVNPATKETDTNGRLASLPTPTRSGSYRFDGWFTTASGGTQITTATVFMQDTTVYAHWTYTGGGSSGGSGSGGGSSSSGYTITVEDTDHGSIRVSPSRASKGDTVTITVDPDAGYELGTLIVRGSNGERIDVERQSDTRYTFEMPSRRVTVEVTFVEITEEPVPSGLPFTDVHTGDYYYDAVAWAVENGVTSGTSATTFSPNNACTRAQIVTFLWRAAGSPEPEATVNPFTDVSTSAYYYDAVLWAVDRGITNGTSATTFSPDATVTRGQTVTFLWRYAGSPTTGTGSFTDVAADAYYATAVAWAAAEGVTSGTSATTFSPDAACTRAQIVTFLYRYLG